MEEILKVAAFALTGTIAALTLKKHNAEAALLVSIAAGILLLITALSYIKVVISFWEDLSRSVPVADTVSGPLIKAVGISVVTKITAELCRDGGEGALAAKTELIGTAACIVVMLPLLSSVLKLILSML